MRNTLLATLLALPILPCCSSGADGIAESPSGVSDGGKSPSRNTAGTRAASPSGSAGRGSTTAGTAGTNTETPRSGSPTSAGRDAGKPTPDAGKPNDDDEPATSADAATPGRSDAGETSQRVSRPGEYRGYSEKMYTGYTVTSEYVAVRDGTKVAIDIYRPKDSSGKIVEAPLPVLWMHMPYGRRAPLGVSIGEIYPGSAALLTDYGYVVAIADFRGLYASFGQNLGYNRGEWIEAARMDAYDITEWLAKQPWSTGKIGMWGCSATGGSQMQAATTAPPSLRAVFPMSCEFDAYPFGVPGGMAPPDGPTRSPPSTVDPTLRDLLAAPVDADTDGSQLQAAFASHSNGLDNLGFMPFRDSVAERPPVKWWLQSSPHTYLNEINGSNIAFYLGANWDEAATKYGVFFTFNNLTRPAKLVIGPSTHCAWSISQRDAGFADTVQDQTGFDIKIEELRFFDYWLKDIDNGIMEEPPVYYYTYDAPKGKEWTASKTWPPAHTRRVPFYLGERSLGTEAPTTNAATKDDFVVDYAATAENPAAHGLVYESAVLERAIQVTGHPVVDLWFASTASDGDVVAYLQNVAPDGSVTSYSIHGRLRASLRKEEPAPYNNLDLPWHPFRREDVQPLVAGEPVELRFDILPLSMLFDVGHKIRLVLAFADTSTPVLMPSPTVSVYRDVLHPSSITLPTIE